MASKPNTGSTRPNERSVFEPLPIWSARAPAGAAEAAARPISKHVCAERVCVVTQNVGWHGKPEMFEVRDNFVTMDPKQVALAADGFRLPKDSPAWRLGFQPIPFDRIGPRPDADRKRLARFK